MQFSICTGKEHLFLNDSNSTRMSKRLNGVWNMVEKQTYTALRSLVVWTQQCKCSDPSDRIYALLNIMENPLTIRPNFLNPVKQVYQDVVLQSLL
jgi:hypothetical protein